MSFTDSPAASPATTGDAATRRRRITRELLTEAEAVGRLLDSNTAAIGTDETLFLKRLRSNLLARAEELGQMTDTDDAPAPAPRTSAGVSPAQARVQTPATEPAQAPRGALDLALLAGLAGVFGEDVVDAHIDDDQVRVALGQQRVDGAAEGVAVPSAVGVVHRLDAKALGAEGGVHLAGK